MYRLTIGICLASALLSTAYLSYVLPTIGGILVLAISQVVVYAVTGGFAWLCRKNVTGSGIVLAMALLAILLSIAIFCTVSPPVGYGAGTIVLICLYAQGGLVVLGCYVGYMLVESRSLRHRSPSASIGKFVVVVILTTGVLAIGLFVVAS